MFGQDFENGHLLYCTLGVSLLLIYKSFMVCLKVWVIFSITPNLTLLFLQLEENSTEGKSKDGVLPDSQSEGTNYFLQYISTPR